MTPRLFLAFLRRDVISSVSYRLQFALDVLGVVLSAATFYFVAKLFGSSLPALKDYGGDYFPFVLIGIAFSGYQGVGLHSFAQSLRQEQYLGTLEMILTAPLGVPSFLIASAQWDFIYATAQIGFYLGTGALLFGLSFPNADLLSAALMLALTLSAFTSLGILSAAFILKFKRGDPVAWLIATVSELLGGVYFPPDALPGWLQRLAALVPMSHALEGLRLALLKGAAPAELLGPMLALATFTAVFFPLGVAAFKLALKSALKDGSLGHY